MREHSNPFPSGHLTFTLNNNFSIHSIALSRLHVESLSTQRREATSSREYLHFGMTANATATASRRRAPRVDLELSTTRQMRLFERPPRRRVHYRTLARAPSADRLALQIG